MAYFHQRPPLGVSMPCCSIRRRAAWERFSGPRGLAPLRRGLLGQDTLPAVEPHLLAAGAGVDLEPVGPAENSRVARIHLDAEADDQLDAVMKATTALRAAIHDAGGGTPGWESIQFPSGDEGGPQSPEGHPALVGT